MKRYFLLTSIISSLFFCTTIFANDSIENLDFVKQRLISYHDSGQYNKDITKVAHRALTYLRFRINQNSQARHPKKLAVVFDIDETSLSNYNDMKNMSFGGTDNEVNSLEMAAHDPAIAPIQTLYNFAEDNHVTVFFVTGRKEYMRKETVENLKSAGYTKWQHLYLKPNNYDKSSVIAYKSGTRKAIEKEGYDIVFTIGDQYSDLKGGYADMTFKVPDPYYYIS